MENKKDIGRAFREKLEKLDQTPPDAIWDAIYADLHPEKKRRAAWIWFPIGFLLLGLAIYSGSRFFNDGQENSIQKVNQSVGNINAKENKTTNKNSDTSPAEIVPNGNKIQQNPTVSIKIKNEIIGNGSTDGTAIFSKYKKSKYSNKMVNGRQKQTALNTKKSLFPKKQKSKNKKKTYKNLFSNKLIAAESGDLSKENLTDEKISKPFDPAAGFGKQLFFSTETDSCQIAQTDSIPKKKRKKTEDDGKDLEPEPDKTAIYVGAFYGPTFYNSFGHNSIMQNTNGYSGKGGVGTTYGAFIRFKIGKKMTLGFGVGKTVYKATTEINERNTNNSFFDFQQIDISGTDNATTVNSYFENDSKVEVRHNIEYFELPVTANYNLYDKTIGIDVIGGMSVYKLLKNDLSVSSATQSAINIGTLNSLMEITASFNGGLQFYYNLGKRWRIEATPSLRYYVSPTKNATDFKPYSFTAQFGMSYKL